MLWQSLSPLCNVRCETTLDYYIVTVFKTVTPAKETLQRPFPLSVADAGFNGYPITSSMAASRNKPS